MKKVRKCQKLPNIFVFLHLENKKVMKKLLYDKFDKKKIADLPRAYFEGKIVVVVSESEAERAVDYLLSQADATHHWHRYRDPAILSQRYLV